MDVAQPTRPISLYGTPGLQMLMAESSAWRVTWQSLFASGDTFPAIAVTSIRRRQIGQDLQLFLRFI